MRPSKNLENKILSEICGRVQAHISSEPLQYYNQDYTRLMTFAQKEDQTPLTLT